MNEVISRRQLDPQRLGLLEDWHGNNIAVACPACLKVFIVSGIIDRKGRDCPHCHQAKGFITKDGQNAWIEFDERCIPKFQKQPCLKRRLRSRELLQD